MSKIRPDSTVAGVKYREVTERFARQYPKVWEKLNSKNCQLARNIQVARIYSRTDRHDEGLALLGCGTHRRARTPKDLTLFNHYCQKPYSCSRCASILANKRAQQLMAASFRFSDASNRSSLRLHSFVIMPESFSIPVAGTEAFPKQTKLLTHFLDLLKEWHAKHNTAWLARGKKQDFRERNKKLRNLLGPTVGSIHLVPCSESKDGYAHAHLHLGIVTTQEHGPRRLRAKLSELYDKAKLQLNMSYTAKRDEPEIRPMTKNRIFRDSQVPDELRGVRWGTFNPWMLDEDKNDRAAVLALKAFNYMSRPFKRKWSAVGIAEARQMCDMMGIKPSRLHRRFGMEQTIRGQLPCDPPMNPDNIQFYAEFDLDRGWAISKPIIRDANGR